MGKGAKAIFVFAAFFIGILLLAFNFHISQKSALQQKNALGKSSSGKSYSGNNNGVDSLLNVERAVMYYSLGDNKPRDLEESVDVLKPLKPQFIWFAFALGPKPLFYSPSQAYNYFLSIGLSKNKAERLEKVIEESHYSVEGFKNSIAYVRKQMPGTIIIISILPQFMPKPALDPESYKPIPESEINKMALNLGKWGIKNPETGKIFDLESTQEIFQRMSGENYIYPDITSKQYQNFLFERIKKVLDANPDGIWIDFLFSQTTAICRILENGRYKGMDIIKHCNFSNEAVKDSFFSACNLTKMIKDYAKKENKTVYVGTWAGFMLYPWKCNYVDFVTESPSPNEVYSLKLDKEKWDLLKKMDEEKYGGKIKIFISPDFGPGSNTMMAVFSQKLDKKEREEFLQAMSEFAKMKNLTVIYPIHGGSMGKDPKKLAFGKHNWYDALAPEFGDYRVVEQVILNP